MTVPTRTGILPGSPVVAQGTPDMTVHVPDRVVIIANQPVFCAADDVTITAADATQDRFDAVVGDDTGAWSVIAGDVKDGLVALPPDTAGYAEAAQVYVFNQAHAAYTGTIVDSVIYQADPILDPVYTLRDGIVSVRDFGAAGDGATDDTSAIQAAIDYASARGGAIVHVPAGTWLTGPLVLKNRVTLQGAGKRSTILSLKDSSNDVFISNYVSSDGTEANAQACTIRDLKLDCNEAGQTGSHSGIYFNQYPAFTKATNDDDFDANHLVENVVIYKASGVGYEADARSETHLINVLAYYCNGHGFQPGPDHYLSHCTAGQCGQDTGDGFYLDSPSIRVTNCKAFYSVSGAGFHITSSGTYGVTLTNCEAQDNYHQGFLLDGCYGTTLSGCVADSNSRTGSGTYPGFELWDARANIVEACVAFERGTDNGGANNQKAALKIRSSSTDNRILLSHRAVGNGTVTAAIDAASTTTDGNAIFINAEDGSQTGAIVAGHFKPVPAAGTFITVPLLTAALAVDATDNPYAGARMTLTFTQDSSGSHTVTWDAQYAMGARSVSTIANAVTTLTFKYDGSNWLAIL